MIAFRVRYMNVPGAPHVYCRVFAATDGGTYVPLGNLAMQHAEFEAFRRRFAVEFVEDGKE